MINHRIEMPATRELIAKVSEWCSPGHERYTMEELLYINSTEPRKLNNREKAAIKKYESSKRKSKKQC